MFILIPVFKLNRFGQIGRNWIWIAARWKHSSPIIEPPTESKHRCSTNTHINVSISLFFNVLDSKEILCTIWWYRQGFYSWRDFRLFLEMIKIEAKHFLLELLVSEWGEDCFYIINSTLSWKPYEAKWEEKKWSGSGSHFLWFNRTARVGIGQFYKCIEKPRAAQR